VCKKESRRGQGFCLLCSTITVCFLIKFSVSGPILKGSVPDPEPDPTDPYVYGPPGSGSVIYLYGMLSMFRIKIVLCLMNCFHYLA
jgi:hypothetical protein